MYEYACLCECVGVYGCWYECVGVCERGCCYECMGVSVGVSVWVWL